MLFEKKENLKYFFRTIINYQKLYWSLDDLTEKENITASELEALSMQKTWVAEQVARYILDRNRSIEIINDELLGND